MFSELFKSRARMQILRDGPGGLLLEGFAQCLSEAGYATITARKHLRAAEHFIHFINWNDRHSAPERKLNKQSLARFERHLSRCRCQQYSHASPQKVVHGVHLFLSHLRDAGIINLPWAPNHDPALLSAFCQWMHQQRGISDVTLSTYSIYIRELLRRIGDQPSRFNTRRLREFVLEKSRSWRRGAAKNCTTAVRMFLRSQARQGALYAYPKEKSIERFMDQVRQRTKRGISLKTTELIVALNPLLRGWGEYYKRAHVRKLFQRLDGWIRRRIWSHRYRRWRNAGWKRLPVTKLYGEYELVRLLDLIPSLASRRR